MSLKVDNGKKGFKVKLSYAITLKVGDSDFLNNHGCVVNIKAGHRMKPIGWKGGNIVLQAGKSVGQKNKGRCIGNRGSMQLFGGDSAEDYGGAIFLNGRSIGGENGGNIFLTSGTTKSKKKCTFTGGVTINTATGKS